MARRPARLRSHCPVNFALEAVGDRWALLILRDIVFRGQRTYGDFLKSEEGFSTNILASRLEHLLAQGILHRDADPDDARKSIYSLTGKGLDLIPLLFEMVLWSAKHDPKSQARLIPGLVELIEKNNRRVSARTRKQVQRGDAVVAQYLTRPS